MSCYLNEETNSIEGVLTFKRDELLYDIENYAYIEGQVMETANEHNRHMVQDVGEVGNVDRITRVLDLNVAKCREILYPFIKHDIHKPALDDTLKETEVYGMVLKLPRGFSQTTLNLLEKLIHEYLVCQSLADWLSITYPVKANIWLQKAEESESEIRARLTARLGRVRRRSHPF